MKLKYIFTAAIVASLSFSACDDEKFLEETPKDFMSSENALTSYEGFEAMLTGIYSKVRDQYKWDSELMPYYGFHTGVDYAESNNSWGYLQTAFHNYTDLNSSHRVVKGLWNWGYKVVANTNIVIAGAQNEVLDLGKEGAKERFEAEARFFRAYAYNQLATIYGDVPLITKPQDKIRYDYTRETKENVLKQIRTDLEFAAEHLPDVTEIEADGILTKAAAQHLLAEVCLHIGTEEALIAAEAAAIAVTTNSNYGLMKVRFGNHQTTEGDPFSDLFKENNQNRASGNKETIWVIQQQYDVNGGGGALTDWRRRIWVPYYSSVDGLAISEEYGGRSLGRLMPNTYWWNLFEDTDMRVSDNNVRRKYFVNTPGAENFGEEVLITPELVSRGALYPSITKFNYFVEGSPTYIANCKDIMAIRLAETYLLLAEAQFKQEKFSEAAISLNEVRSRANATPITGADVSLDFILDERARELIGESHRRLTLVRTGTLVERTKKYNKSIAGTNIKEHNKLWPIPQTVIDANSEVVLEQNPVY